MTDGSTAWTLTRDGSARGTTPDALPESGMVSNTAIPVPPRMPATISNRLRLRVAWRACLPGGRTALPPRRQLARPRSTADPAVAPARTEPRIIVASTLAGRALIGALALLGRLPVTCQRAGNTLRERHARCRAQTNVGKNSVSTAAVAPTTVCQRARPAGLHRLGGPQAGSYSFDDDCLLRRTFESGKAYGHPGAAGGRSATLRSSTRVAAHGWGGWPPLNCSTASNDHLFNLLM